MAKRGYSEEEILRVLREAESGDTVVEICSKPWDQLAELLPVEEKVRGPGPERAA